MKKHFTIYCATIVMIFSAVVFVRTLTGSVFYAPVAEMASASTDVPAIPTQTPPVQTPAQTPFAQAEATTTVSRQPSRLIIPSLDIDAHVQATGITKKGNMGTPTNFTDVAWYKYGAIPGDIGNAVIDGHVDNGLSLAGVFKHVAEIAVGADIYTVDAQGNKIHFVVTDVTSYDYLQVPVTEIFNDMNGSRLRLITCGGTWVPGEKTYDKRVVVTAVLE